MTPASRPRRKWKIRYNTRESRKEIVNINGMIFGPSRQAVFIEHFLHFLLTRPEVGGTPVRETRKGSRK
jgi:hypothetical protein